MGRAGEQMVAILGRSGVWEAIVYSAAAKASIDYVASIRKMVTKMVTNTAIQNETEQYGSTQLS
jgi:hypothetical protein